jgi:hypothetical protein
MSDHLHGKEHITATAGKELVCCKCGHALTSVTSVPVFGKGGLGMAIMGRNLSGLVAHASVGCPCCRGPSSLRRGGARRTKRMRVDRPLSELFLRSIVRIDSLDSFRCTFYGRVLPPDEAEKWCIHYTEKEKALRQRQLKTRVSPC